MTATKHHFSKVRALLASAAVILAGAASAAPPPAGTLIEAQAIVSYFDTQLGIYESVPSNIVVTKINAVPAVEVVFDQTVHLSPDTQGQFAFFIRNIGNTPLNPTILLEQMGADQFDLVDPKIVIDQNGNGIADPGELELAPGGQVDLPIGTELPVIVTFATPPGVGEGDAGIVRLSATDDAATGAATGTAIISTTGLSIEKSANLTEAEPGMPLRYFLRLRNRGFDTIAGYSEIGGEPILVDGAAVSGVLVRDAIPLNTTASSLGAPANFIGLYHVAGQPTHTYQSAPPADLGTVDAVAFFKSGDYPPGSSSDLTIEVVVADNVPTGVIANTARTWQLTGSGLVELPSNLVRTPVMGPPATLEFTDPAGVPTSKTGLDTNVRLRLDAAACNATPGVDMVQVTIVTTPEGDREVVMATETGANTGVFTTALIPVQRVLPAVQGDGILSGDKHTIATASVVCGGETVTGMLVINPGGFVFHSASNMPVAGAVVILYDAGGVEVTRSTSDSDGFYVIDSDVAPGTYRIAVLPPDGLVFPSQRTLFPGWGRDVHPEASYGELFTTAGGFTGVDIPLDPDTSAGLILEKSADIDFAAPGDIVVYTLKLTNDLDLAVANVVIEDVLPAGLVYLEGTARLDGAPVAVAGTPGPELTFTLGTVGRLATVTLTYAAAIEPLASGRLINTAHAEGQYYGDGTVRSNDARAVLRVQRDGGVFSDAGVVLGKVYVDFNGNGIQDAYLSSTLGVQGLEQIEPGIAGVKLYFSNGASVVTDAEGKYSMPGLPSGTHVVAVSTRTLPAGVELVTTRTRDALSPQSRLLYLQPGQVVAEYFAVRIRDGASRGDLLAELAARAEDFSGLAEGDGSREERLRAVGGDAWIDYRDRLAASGDASRPTLGQIVVREPGEGSGFAVDARTSLALDRTRDLEAEIRGLTPALGFVDLKADDLLNTDVVSVRVKGPVNGRLELKVNGEPVSPAQVGQRAVFASGGVQAVEYVAVRLKGGRNRLELAFADPFGNVRERREIEVLAPGRATRIELIAPPAAYADPSSPIPIVIRLVDAEGLPTYASMDVTLEAVGRGKWAARDIRETEPGIQVFIDRGEALIDYYPPARAGTEKLAVRNGLGRFESELKLLADDSERIIVGVVEGVVRIDQATISDSGLSGFEAVTAGAHGELYLKGKIKGDALLTLRYDSDQDSAERLFRDIDPERYYPVYGDKSERGYDAQSRSPLFVKVEKGLNYVLYGDIDVAPQASGFKLATLSRALTGVQGHYEEGPVTIDLFAGRADQSQVIREFQADSLSGPYDLDLSGYIEGSEVVEIVTRDSRQPSIVLHTVRLSRYRDYRLDFFSDAIVFNSPITALDADGNFNFIRVTYEVKGEGDAYWVFGGEARYRINDNIAVGYREIRSQADAVYDDRAVVRGGYVTAELGEFGTIEAEVAQSEDKTGASGFAARVDYAYAGDGFGVGAHAAHIGEGFLEGGTSPVSGRDEANVRLDWRATPDLTVRAGALYDRKADTGDQRYGGELFADWRANQEVAVHGGVRYLYRRPGDGSGDQHVPSAVIGGDWRPAFLKGLSLRSELEADVTDLSHLRALVEASHRASEEARFYARANWASSGSEFLDFSSANGAVGSMTAGLEYRLSAEMTSFAEMRNGSQMGVAGGLKGDWALSDLGFDDWAFGEDARFYASIEHFQPYDLNALLALPFGVYNPDQSAQTSLAAGYRAALDGGEGRLGLGAELTFKDGGTAFYTQQYWAQRQAEWTFALENRLALSDRGAAMRLRDHLRLGAALRPEDESLDALFLAGVKYDNDFAADIGSATAYWSAAGSWALDPQTRVTGKQAGQYQGKVLGEVLAQTFLLLGQAGIERDFEIDDGLRLRLGIDGAMFYDAFRGTTYWGAGAEIGFVPSPNVLIGAGWNVSNVNAADVSEIYTSGPYLRLSVKLDDSLWSVFDRAGLTVPVGE